MIKKGLVVAVILLFIGVAFAIPINANVSKSSLEPVPDLDCDGAISWSDYEPGMTLYDWFWVENIGEPGSELDWEIVDWPEWGEWLFIPLYGSNLMPEDGPITIEVECVLPEPPENDICDEIKVVNLENPDDFDTIPVFIKGEAVPVVKNINQQSTTSLIKQNIMSTVSSASKMTLDDTTPPVTTHEFIGTMGDNDWYVSDVTVELTATDDMSGVNVTYYMVDDEEWIIYYGPFVVINDGEHAVEYYSVDNAGNEEEVNGPFDFKKDATPPTIELTWDKDNSLIMADAEDLTSGIAKVEFYVNDEYLGNVTSAPYEWEYTGGNSSDIASAIAYDNAGNLGESDRSIVESSYLQFQRSKDQYMMPSLEIWGQECLGKV